MDVEIIFDIIKLSMYYHYIKKKCIRFTQGLVKINPMSLAKEIQNNFPTLLLTPTPTPPSEKAMTLHLSKYIFYILHLRIHVFGFWERKRSVDVFSLLHYS